jgi:hypothetical protein
MSQIFSRSLKVLMALGALLACTAGPALAAPRAGARPTRRAPVTTTRVAAARIARDAAGFGAHVIVFTPSMPQSEIQAELNAISDQQVPANPNVAGNPTQSADPQFTTRRYAIFFEPGTYGTAADPLAFQVGFYTQVAGLGATPGDVVINGVAQSLNQCTGTPPPPNVNDGGQFYDSCSALDNFWRSLSNLTINVTSSPSSTFTPDNGEPASCADSNEIWAVSQAAPMRRVIVNGATSLDDYCGRGYASGGFLGDDTFSNVVINGTQQQFFTRNSNIDNGWTNGVWNQVFLGDNGAPAQNFDAGGQYTTLPTTPVSQEAPFLYTDPSTGALQVFVPSPRANSVGPDYAAGPAVGSSLPLREFFVADPATPVAQINAELDRGRDLIFAPGVYHLDRTIEVRRPDTVVLGLGFATLIPDRGQVAMQTADVPGVKLSGLIFDAGPVESPALLSVGRWPHGGPGWGDRREPGRPGRPGETASDPTLLSDVFFRIGGAEPGRATDALIVNTDHTILDDIWAWRADHGAGVGWTQNTANTGLIVNGDDVRAYGLAVEHFQKDEVIWNGQHGEDVFFQNEMPYDPPSQSAWMASPTSDGYPAFRVADGVTSFAGYGMGSYSFFNQGVDIFADNAFSSPVNAPGDQWHDLLTVFLDPVNGSGGIRNVINDTGGSSTKANPSTPVDVISYP